MISRSLQIHETFYRSLLIVPRPAHLARRIFSPHIVPPHPPALLLVARPLYFRASVSSRARVERLDSLKALAKEYVERPEVQARAKELRRILRGESSNSGWPSIGSGGSDSVGSGGSGGKGKNEGDTSSSSSPSSYTMPGFASASPPPSPQPAAINNAAGDGGGGQSSGVVE